MAKKKSGNWMAGAVKHPGALRSELGVTGSGPIPAKKLKAATKSKNPLERRRAVLAETFRKANHKKAK